MIKRPLVRCGNSIGVNIPPALLELVGVTAGDEAEIGVEARICRTPVIRTITMDGKDYVANALRTAGRTAGVKRAGHDGYRWASRTAAFAALRAIKTAVNVVNSCGGASGAGHSGHPHTEEPSPRWAVKAQAAGWKPPKGWTP